MRVRTHHPRRLPARAAAVLVAIGLLLTTPVANASAPLVIDLGSAGQFAVLAGDGIVDTGPSVIIGDVGTYPRPAISSVVDDSVTGTVHRASADAEQAQVDLADGYDMAAGATPGAIIAGGVLGGRTLLPGVYVADAGALALAGTVTLDGRGDPDAVWILQATSDLLTEPGSVVRLVNGARACNVFWQVPATATLGSASTFAGTILAMASVTVGSGVTIDGRALARTARVTLAGDTITVPACSVTRAPTTSTIATTLTTGTLPTGTLPFAPLAAPASAGLAATGGGQDRLPWFLPIVAIISIAAAVVLGEPRRRRYPTSDRGW